jgi:iron complex outermembrane receptor protein
MRFSGGGRSAAAFICAYVAAAHSPAVRAAQPFEEVVVTATRMHAPGVIVTDPRAPRQPLPAHDGADYLKTIPGFSVIRKGGTDGDPVFRGMAASRVNILLDGEQALGGCGMRMDPPTAYVFPEAYDRIVVVKGPQSVLQGPGSSAAAVSFEREPPRFASPGYAARASLLGASFGRSDLVGDLRAGNARASARLTATRAAAGDYADGAGNEVHSAYERWSVNAALGGRPGGHTRVEITAALSDGEAAYADRGMDGVAFERENVGMNLVREDLGENLRRLEARAYYNDVDHVMDNFSLRSFTPSPTMPFRSVQNPQRRTAGGRISLELALPDEATATLGADLQENRHSLRATMNEDLQPYERLPRIDDAWFRSVGGFAELNQPLRARTRAVAGVRADRWEARDERQTLRTGMATVANPTAGDERSTTLTSAFARLEHGLADRPATLYAGLGYVQRFPDYWELVSAGKESVRSLSAFHTSPEKTTQLDAGLVWSGARVTASVSGFYGGVDDYILIETAYPKGPRRVTVTRNVQARTWGGEADLAIGLAPRWSATGTLAYVRGENRSDDRPLAQMPPLELRSSLEYAGALWSAGALWRVVAEQDRYAVNQGNVVGQDLGRTGGFGIVSLNGGWRPRPGVLVTAGVDNLFDKFYAEHLSRGGALVAGFEQTTRVNEPGRTLWLKVGAALD